MQFTDPKLKFEYMDPFIKFHCNAIECGEWIETLSEDLRVYAVDAVYKANAQLLGQRISEANRKIFIHTVLSEMMATAHEHVTHGVKDSALLRAMK